MQTRSYSAQLSSVDDFDSLLANRKNSNVDAISAERQRSKEKFLRLEKVMYGNIEDYSLPNGTIYPRHASEFIEVLRRGGRLNKKSMQKLLGRAYRELVKCPNITELDLLETDTLTVVGDLHGTRSFIRLSSHSILCRILIPLRHSYYLQVVK